MRRGLAESRSEAQEAIRAGHVTVRGAPATKSTTLVGVDEPLAVVARRPRPYVSRGGEKLAAALDRFSIDPAGRGCLDAGASTGGFTDCLLQRGARHVVAVDVGYGQLAWQLRRDLRVTVLEKTNVRDLDPSALPYRPSLVTADLSFISLRLVAPTLVAAAEPGADLVLLVKPQFESGREHVGRGGVVRDPEAWRLSIEQAAEACRRSGAGPMDVMASPVRGPAGNVEFLLWARVGGPGRRLDLGAAIERASEIRDR